MTSTTSVFHVQHASHSASVRRSTGSSKFALNGYGCTMVRYNQLIIWRWRHRHVFCHQQTEDIPCNTRAGGKSKVRREGEWEWEW
jgi:hypothetical protein